MQYERLKSKHLVDPHATEAAEEDLAINNPLSQAAESPWTRYFHLQVGPSVHSRDSDSAQQANRRDML